MSVGRGEDDDTCAMYNVMHSKIKAQSSSFHVSLLHLSKCYYIIHIVCIDTANMAMFSI